MVMNVPHFGASGTLYRAFLLSPSSTVLSIFKNLFSFTAVHHCVTSVSQLQRVSSGPEGPIPFSFQGHSITSQESMFSFPNSVS